MQASNVRTPIAEHNGTLFVAIELSQQRWLVTMHSPDRNRFSRHPVEGGDAPKLLGLIERIRARAMQALGSQPRVVSCYEAGFSGFWLHRRLEAAGITNFVFDPASIAVDQRARRVKTDRIDGELLLRTLMAYCRGEPRVVRIVRVPSPEQEDARRATRERERLIKEQTAHTNRIKGLLRLWGVAAGNPRRRDWASWLKGQRDGNGCLLQPQQLAELKREHARLMLVSGQLRELSQDEQAPASAAVAEMARRSATLQRLKGIGSVFATTLTNEALYKDFHNRREVGSYVGLAPSPWCSGASNREQGISKAGNPRARAKAIELAWLWLEHQPQSALSRWFHERTAHGRGRIRRIAIVALARKLIVALWRFLTTGLVPEGAVLKAVA
jgi:transposase